MSRYAIFGILIQCMLYSFVFARYGEAQKMSIEKIHVTIEIDNLSIKETFSEIENATDFTFAYKEKSVDLRKKLSLTKQHISLADLLRDISRRTDLRFKRINEIIYVGNKGVKSPGITFEDLVTEEKTITGRVTDKDGAELPGVNVLVKGSNVGTITDINGNYSLNVPDDATTLVFSYVGYSNMEVEIGSSLTVDVVMEENVSTLSEVVVLGYTTQDKKVVSGSVAKVDGGVIENMPTQSFDRALQGRIAGVQISSSSGALGGAIRVRVRGSRSINAGNAPLYIVDGVQLNSGGVSSGVASSNILNSINPNDIESVEVLKDAAATSLYGALGANGVIIITTKSGKSGKPKFNVNANFTTFEVINQVDVLNASEWKELRLEGLRNDPNVLPSTIDDLAAQYAASTIDTDWQDLVYGRGFSQVYEVSASGGTDQVKYFISGSYNDADGHVLSSEYERATLRTNLDVQANDKLKISPKLNIAWYRLNQGQAGLAFSNAAFSAPLLLPIDPVRNEDGTFNTNLTGGFIDNPIQSHTLNEDEARVFNILGSLDLEYEIIKGLKYRGKMSLDLNDVEDFKFDHPETVDGRADNGRVAEINSRLQNLQTDHTLTYKKDFGKHSITGLGGFTYRHASTKILSVWRDNFTSLKLRSLDNAEDENFTGKTDTDWKLAGYFGRVDYTFDGKYIFNVTVRRDGSSRFGERNRYGTFPAVSGAWRISDESFMQNVSFVDNLKLRASWGVSGNAFIGNFDHRTLYGVGNLSYNGQGGWLVNRPGNDLLTWEENTTTNIGLDFGFIQGRVNGSVDVFRSIASKLLLDRQIPQTSGSSTIRDNIGRVRNSGIELELSSVNVDNNGFRWTTDFNITFLDSEVLELTPETDTLITGGGNTGLVYIVGQEFNGYLMQRWAGVNPADGRPMWYDRNGEITYTKTDADRVFVGSFNPDYYGGITNTFEYKGFELSAFFQFQVGNKIYNSNRRLFETSLAQGLYNQTQRQFDERWRNPGDVTGVAIPVNNYNYANGADASNDPFLSESDKHLEKGDYIRLKQLSLAYNLPSSILERAGLSSARIYAQGVNIWTETAYTGFDPEFAGNDFGDLPTTKSWLIGVQIGF
ncbi:TonB-dependent receptor [Fulvivirgaceae bacterium BMA10]|uniref:TonB-dependent receptor n=1 Tax=Splendidivirga corallicola TaxID=3051826 RepID=A0ABT8KH89_9BACT|nr:TonB-dependent receptor [Fulvivirgaceae bacterium BMA10]